MTTSILITVLEQLLFSWFGILLSVVTVSGIGLIALYFTSFQFRRMYNLFIGPKGRQARYGYRKGAKGLQVLRSGYAFDEDEGSWRYVKSRYIREYRKSSYTRYMKDYN